MVSNTNGPDSGKGAFTVPRRLAIAVSALLLGFPPSASADPKPAGCAGAWPATLKNCTFVVGSGNDGGLSYAVTAVGTGRITVRIDVLRAGTVIATSGDMTDAEGTVGTASFSNDNTLPSGTYTCRVTSSAATAAAFFSCATF